MTGTAADKMEIAGLSDRFGRSLDTGDLAMFLSIFAPDVAYRSGPRCFGGKGELEAFFVQRARAGRVSRHFYSGLIVDFQGADQATGSSIWVTFAGEGALPLSNTRPYLVADVEDEYRRIDGRWLIVRRDITPVFRDDATPPPAPATGNGR